ncbi:MAG TPA: NUDIX hydrolase [Roseiarcus sp.]|nr:NUDIX hydrolase [Roseiarcus sp.]
MSGEASRIRKVAALELTYKPQSWAFAEERAADILAHWSKAKAAKPSLFDGKVLLMSAHEFIMRADGQTILRGQYLKTDYKAFLAWRDLGFPDRSVRNGFAMAALQSSDGAYLLGEMGSHTANAGSVYFAAGTPDENDLFGDRVDLRASVLRELEEETGIRSSDIVVAADWILVDAPPRIACLKPVRSAEDAKTLKARIEAHLASEATPELARIHIVRSTADINETRMPRFIVDFLRHAFSEDHISVG